MCKNFPLRNGEALDLGIRCHWWMRTRGRSTLELDTVLYQRSFHPASAHSASEPLVELASFVGRSWWSSRGKDVSGQHVSEGWLDQLSIHHGILSRDDTQFNGANFLQREAFSRPLGCFCYWFNGICFRCHEETALAKWQGSTIRQGRGRRWGDIKIIRGTWSMGRGWE